MPRISVILKYIFVALFAMIIFSCSESSNFERTDDNSEGDIVRFTASLQNKSRTLISDLMDEFYVYAFSGKTNKGRDIKFTWTGSEWVSESIINWPKNEISFYALSRSFSVGKEISKSVMKYNDQHIIYTVPPDSLNPDSTNNLFFASRLNTTSAEQGGSVHLEFVYSLAYPYFTCVQAIEDVRVIIKEIITHNLKTTGVLTYEAMDSKASWELVDTLYGNYRQVLPTPIELNSDLTTAVQISQPWIWMPQKPIKWKTKDGSPVTTHEADSLHQSYVELKCQIIKDGSYLWGAASGENEYESVYYPFNANFSTQGYKRAIKLTFTGGYLEDGTPWKPRSGAAITIASWVTIDALVDPWEEMEPEDLIF